MVFAAVAKSPCVFFVQNNQWAISEPTHRNFVVEPFKRAAGFGFPGVRVDGNDILASLAVGAWALDHARSGKGPVLVEAFTYRMGAHTTSDDPSKYRRDAETEEWRGRDPIARLTTYLRNEGAVDDAHMASLDQEAKDYGASIRASIANLTDKTMDEQFRTVYAEESIALEEQRREYADYLATFEETA